MVSGLHGLLAHGWVYDFFQALLGGARTRRWLQREFFQARPGERVLDVGCGTADVLSVLPDVDYVGFDVSTRYIERAQARWGTRARFFPQALDRGALRSLGQFDLILATGLLHHLDDQEVSTLFETLHPALATRGRIVTVDGCYVDGQNPVARFIIGQDRGDYVRTPQAYEALARTSLGELRGWVIHRRWVPYTYWIMRGGKRSP